VRVLGFFLVLIAGGAWADDHWLTYTLDLRYPRWAQALDRNDARPRAGFSIVFPASALLQNSGWRLPIDSATFLTLDASIVTSHVNPYINSYLPTTRSAFQATFGVAVEY
jgi:hypothetical protein